VSKRWGLFRFGQMSVTFEGKAPIVDNEPHRFLVSAQDGQMRIPLRPQINLHPDAEAAAVPRWYGHDVPRDRLRQRV